MKKIRTPLNNFTFGEVSPSLLSRVDTPVYNNSAKTLTNFNLRPEGGVARRHGTDRIYDYGITQNTAKTFQSKLVPFVFSDDEKYIASIEDAKVRVFTINATTGVVTLAVTLTADNAAAALPFDHDYIHEYSFAHQGDVLFITHPLFIPRMLVRTSLDTFEVQTYSFDSRTDGNAIYQPYYNFQAANVTLTSSATTGTGATLTTSAAHFDTTGSQTGGDYLSSLHVGVTLRYGESEITITSVQSATSATGDVTDTLRQRLLLNSLKTIDTSTTIEVTHIAHGFAGGESITIEDADKVGGVSSVQINGARTIGAILDENTYEITSDHAATSGEDGGGLVKIVTGAANISWTEQAFSAKRGYPAACVFHENRLVFAGTTAQPDYIWLSNTGRYFKFDVGDANDAESIQIVGTSGTVNQIRHLVSNRDLQLFGVSGELYVPTYLNQVITPTNAQIRSQTPYGSSWCKPMVFDGATLFAQKGGSVIREYLFTDNEAAYSSSPVSTLSAHLISNPSQIAVVDGAFDGSESYALMVMDDGTLSVFNSSRAEKRAGWTPYASDGTFHSVVEVDGRLFTNVWFDTGSSGTPDLDLMLCEFHANCVLDCSTSYTLTAGVATVSSEFSNDAVVDVVADGDWVGSVTVSGGEIDISSFGTYTTAEVGFSVDVELEPNPIDLELQMGPRTGRQRAISAVILDLVATRAVKVNDTPKVFSTAYTGKKEIYTHGYSRDITFTITQSEHLALQINGLISEVII